MFLRLYYLRMHLTSQALCAPYMETLEPEKLLQLRAKTDQQLLEFIHSKLEVGLNFAALAETIYSGGNCASARRSIERGNQALNDVQLLLTVLNEKQRRGLDSKVNKLREALERLSWLRESLKAQTAASS
jgi:hypothetical protein